MKAIIKSWPAFMAPRRVLEVFTADWCDFYFTLGRSNPKQAVRQLYFTYRGRILGHFEIREFVKNEGQLPKLMSLSGEESEWQIKPDRWVAICDPPFHRLREKLYYAGFRGWRYFDLEKHRGSIDARIAV